jgi:hypothetical protein
MSLRQEARVLTLLLKNLARQGSLLSVSKPSMEQARHFAQLTNAYLLPTGVTKLNLSVESNATPESVVDASMESIFSTIKGLLGIGEKIDKDKKDSEKAYFTDLYKKNLELKAKNSKAFQDKAWMAKAELNEGVISITGGHGDMFHRNQTSMKTASDVIKEFNKDLSALRKSFGDFVKQCKPYLNWTKASWDKCEKAYEDFEDSMDGTFDDDDPKLEAKITTIVEGFLAKRPAVPSDAARTLPAGLLGSDKKPVRLELVAATKEEIAKVIELWETILEFTYDVMESEYELQGMGCGGDFTDYPWRCEAMQKAIYTNKNDFSKWTGYDAIDEFVYDPLQEFVDVIDNLENAIYHYISVSIKTKP